MTDTPCLEDFTPLVGQVFRFEGGHATLRLASAVAAPHAGAPGSGRTPFILIFHGPDGEVLAEGLYRAEAEGGTAMEFYLMPIHTVVPARQDYQAVFN